MAVNLLLVGRTGNGKSSTGNSILGAKDFQPRMPRDSIIVEILKKESARDDGSTMTVVDGPGIGDSSLNDKRGVWDTIKQVDKAINLCPDGFDAVIQVLNIGVRFTQQEKDSIKMMKSIFGKDIIKNHGIIIMTSGDNFTLDADDEHITFKDWCTNQVGDIVEIFKECNYRCVLFNNRAKDDKTLNKQRDDLLAIVKQLTYKNGKYTTKDYADAVSDRNKLLVSSNLPALEKENKIVMNEIFADIEQLDITSGHDFVLASISDLEKKFDRQKQFIEEQMKGVEIPKGIQLDLDLVRTKIKLTTGQVHAHRELRKQDKRQREKSSKGHYATNTEEEKHKRYTNEDNARHKEREHRSRSRSRDSSYNIDLDVRYKARTNFLLVGRTGNGKSSTGNSILRAKQFQPRMPRDSIIVEILKGECVDDDGSTITVVDGPGIGDSSLNDQRGVKHTIKQAGKAISLSPDGFDAVIQVLKFGVHFTQQEKDSIKMMKSIFGKDIIKNHGIIIMTHGDNFTLDADDEHITFIDWCSNQVGDIVEIFKECNYKYVLFNNRAKDDDTLNCQRNDLLAIVKELTDKNGKYTYKDYADAVNDRNKLLVSSNLPALEKENKIVMNEIFADIEQLDITSGHESVLDSISDLEKKFDRQKQFIEEQMKGVEIPKCIQLDLDLVRMRIDMFKQRVQCHREFRQSCKNYRQ